MIAGGWTGSRDWQEVEDEYRQPLWFAPKHGLRVIMMDTNI